MLSLLQNKTTSPPAPSSRRGGTSSSGEGKNDFYEVSSKLFGSQIYPLLGKKGWIVLVLALLSLFSSAQTDEQYLAGSAYFLKGDYRKAVESLNLVISRNNSDEQLYILRGRAYLGSNETEKAVADFSEANLIRPRSADLWLSRAWALQGDKDKAISFLESHLRSPFRIPEDSIKKDPAYNSIQDSREWYDLWEKEWYPEAEMSIADAKFYAKRRHYDRAIAQLDEAIMKNTGHTGLLVERAKIFIMQGNYVAAAGDLSSAINANRNNTELYAQRGFAYLKSERYREAVNDFNRAIRNDPARFGLYVQRAEAYAAQKSWTQAIKDMQLYLKYFDNDLQALYTCGEYYYAAGDFMNALKCFNRNLKEDPNNAKYYKARGKTYLNTSTHRYAINDLSMSLDLQPNDAETWMYHGLAAIKTGDRQAGCSSLRKAQKLGSTEAVRYLVENCE